MITVREMCQRARDRAGALARGLILCRYPAPTPSEEQALHDLLHLAANTITPSSDALTRIRTRIGGAPLHGDAAATTDDQLGSETPMSIISKPARAVVPGDTITRHPDHGTKVRLRVIAGARAVGDGALIDYTAPADELPGLTPNDRASGVLFLAPNQTCEVEPAPAERTKP